MRYKKIMILTIIFTCLLAVSAVCAAENATDDVVSSDSSTGEALCADNVTNYVVYVEDKNQDIESVNDINDYLSANSDGTFTDLANDIAAANGELKLSRNYVYDSSKDLNYKNGIVINKELTINGKGFIINGENNARAFTVSNGNVVLRNIEFINCYSSDSGGAVYWNGANGSLYDCDFINCYSSDSGGAVYWNSKNGSLHDCDFMKCYKSKSSSGSGSGSNSNSGTASGSGSSSGSGGAVYWAGADGSLFNCCFEDCNNSQYDSYSYSYYSGSFSAGSSSYSYSNSYSYGGAVYWAGADGSLFDCDFINCYSYSYSYSSDKIYNAYRELCVCSVSSSSYSYGSVYWAGKNGNLSDCSFINSTSSSASSSKYNYNRELYGSGNLDLYFYSYCYSNSYSYGGAVYWAGKNGNLFDCNFITPNSKPSSSSSGSGGAVYWYGTDGDLSNCSFMNCRIPDEGYANAVYWYGANGGLLNCSFVDCNSSSNSGYNGSVYWSGTKGELFNCSFNGDYYNYENYCSKSSSSTVYPVMLIHTSHNLNNDGSIVIFECTQLVNNISVTLYNVTGRKILYDEFDISSDDLTSSYTVNYLEGGEYQMVLQYGGDNFYTSTSTNNLFKTLYKSNIKLDLKNNYIFDEKIPLNYNIAPNCTGIISIYIDNVFKANISVGNAFEFETLDAGEYDITVIYNGDKNFTKSNDSCILKVSKADPSIEVNSSNLLGDVLFVIGLNETATGNVTLILNDINSYHGTLTNGKTNIIVPNLNAGDCSVKIIYNGCKNYNNKTYATTLTIDKIPTTVTATVDDITYTENAIINVKGSVDGIAIVKIDESYIKNINVIANTMAPATFENIPVGKHNVTITLKPTNTNYDESTYNTDFTVSKKDASVSLKVADSIYGEDVIVNVTAGEDGKIILKVGSITREKNVLANTLTKINLGVLAASSYNVELIFDAGENYKPSTKNDNIVISPAKAEILILQAENNVYGDNTIIKVKTNVEGTLTFNVGSNTRLFDIVANKLTSFNFGILDAKTYAVEASLDAGNNYTKPINTTQFTIESKQTTVEVNVKNSTYGEHVIVNVTASENGEISVNIGDITKHVNVEANKVYSVDFSVLNADSYNVYVSFDGGNNYKKSYDNGFLIVSPAKSQITEIQAPNNSYGENTIIKVKTNVGGILTAKINTITKEVNVNANQLTNIDFGILDANNYEVELSFNAGNNYVPTTATKTFKVLKTDPTISVAVTNATYGQAATIIVNSNTEGNVTIEIGSVKTYYNVLFKNNVIIQDVTDIDAGQYSVKVTYNGNNNYNVKTYGAKLTINKASTTVVGAVDDITYTENAIINVKGSVDGIAIVKIDESYIKNIYVIANTMAPATFENIPVGKHNVTITLKPTNTNYDESTYNTDFIVSKKETTVNLNVIDSVYGKDVIVNVTASEDGKVILNVGDITREKNVLANIQTTINLGVLSAKSYDVEVIFNAGENYKLSTQQKSFTIIPAKVEITAIQVQNNTYGENTIINVKTNVSGILTVKLNNANTKTFNIDANKLTSLDLGKYDADEYDIDLSLDAGSNYTKATGNAKVTVNPKQTTVELNVNDNIYGKNVIVNVTASENGKVTVNVGTNGRTVDVEANKCASIDFGILDAQSYEVNATFNGGKNYQISSDKDSLVVSPKASSVTLVDFVNNYIYSQNVIIKLKTDADGTLTVKVGDTPQTKQVTAGNVVSFDWGILDVKTYGVTINFDAGDNYIPYQNTTSITINPKSTTVSCINPVNRYTYSEKVIIKLKTDADGILTVKVGDTPQTKQVTAGNIVTFDFGILDVNNYGMTINLTAGNNYIPYQNTTSIIITPKSTSIVLNTKTYDTSERVIVNVTASENGKVTLEIGDIVKIIDVDANNVTSIDLGILDGGSYEITANFKAGHNYIDSSDSKSLKVLYKLDDNNVNVYIPLIKSNHENNIIIMMPNDADGNITLTIDNTDYYFQINNGVANLKVPKLNVGNYNYTIFYFGNQKYSSYTNVGELVVKSMDTVIVVESTFSRYATDYNAGERGEMFYGTLYDVYGNPLKSKNVQITINGVIYSVVTDDQGNAGLQVNLGSANTYTYALYFKGDDEYSASLLASSKLTVVKKPTSIIANSNYAFKTSANTKAVTVALNTIKNPFNGKLYLSSGKTLTLTVDGKTYSAKTDAKGVAKFNIQLTKKGTFTATIKFDGDKTYEAVSKSIKITISDSAGSNAALKGVGVGMTPKNINTDTKYNIEGDYAQYIANSNVPISNEDSNKKSTYIEVEKTFTRMATDFNAGERGAYFYATLRDSDGNPLVNKTVQIAVNGPVYTVITDSEGKCGLQVNLGSANTYTYALAFSGDDECNPASLATSKLTVTKKPITITASAPTFTASAKTKTVTVTLKTSKNLYNSKTYLKSGKKVTITVNGKTYSGTIDANGVAKINIGSLTKKGTYNAVVNFAGDNTYNSASNTIKITIK